LDEARKRLLRRKRSMLGIKQFNTYGFTAIVKYHTSSGIVSSVHIETSNQAGKPLYFRITCVGT